MSTTTHQQKRLRTNMLTSLYAKKTALFALFFSLHTPFSYTSEDIAEAQNQDIIPWNMPLETISGGSSSLNEWRGKVLLIVNTASECGLAFQMKELETIYNRFKDKGFVVIGFPSNDFLHQEPGTNAEIQETCSLKFHTTFPLYGKIHVRGSEIHPLYQWLTNKTLHPKFGGSIMWNYTKFLINRNGQIAERFSPITSPSSESVLTEIEKLLSEPVPKNIAPS